MKGKIGDKNGVKLRILVCSCAQMCAMGKYVPNYPVGTEPSAHCAPRCVITQFSHLDRDSRRACYKQFEGNIIYAKQN